MLSASIIARALPADATGFRPQTATLALVINTPTIAATVAAALAATTAGPVLQLAAVPGPTLVAVGAVVVLAVWEGS